MQHVSLPFGSRWHRPAALLVAGLCLMGLFSYGQTSLHAQEAATPLADLTSVPGIDRFATSVRYVYLEPSQVQKPGFSEKPGFSASCCKATFFPDGCSGKISEIRSLYKNGGIAYKNWAPYQTFCMDVLNPQDMDISLTVELRSDAKVFSKTFELAPAKWTEVALALVEAGKKIKLDNVTELRVQELPESVKAPNVLYLDQPRLTGGDAAQAQKARAAEDATASARVPAPPPRFPAAEEAVVLDVSAGRKIHLEKEAPVAAETEVLVVGGGLAGVAAAVASARGGAKTILVERSGALGGMATVGLVPPALSLKLTGGLVKEMDDRLKALGGSAEERNPELIKLVLLDLMRDAGAKTLFYALATDAVVEDKQVKGVIIESKGGAKAILSKVVIDCTGDADIAAYAGAPFEMGRGRDTETQAVTLVFLLANVDTRAAFKFLHDRDVVRDAISRGRKEGALKGVPNASGICAQPVVSGEHGAINVNSINIPAVNALNPGDLTYAHIQCLREIAEMTRWFRKYVPGCKDCYLIQTGTYLGVRESRRIVGEYMLTGADIIGGRSFADAVARGFYSIDIHTADSTGDAGGGRLTQPYDIPYRCLVPKAVGGLLVAGRPISVDHVAHGSVRIMGTTMAVGQAAGTAAAMAVKSKTQPRQVDGAKVQAALRAAGAWPDYVKRVPDNLALKMNGTAAEADSYLLHSPPAEGAIDGGIMDGSLSRWVSAETPEPHWLALAFTKPETVGRVVLHFWTVEGAKTPLSYVPTQYQIQYEREGQWVDLVAERNNQKLDPEYTFTPVTAQRVRLLVTKVRGKDTIVRLREIEVHKK